MTKVCFASTKKTLISLIDLYTSTVIHLRVVNFDDSVDILAFWSLEYSVGMVAYCKSSSSLPDAI